MRVRGETNLRAERRRSQAEAEQTKEGPSSGTRARADFHQNHQSAVSAAGCAPTRLALFCRARAQEPPSSFVGFIGVSAAAAAAAVEWPAR